MPTYEPDVWNATAQKSWENNCYNYATNIQKEWHPPLLPGADRRITLYRLYHELNHLNLFGRGYYNTCIATMNQLL